MDHQLRIARVQRALEWFEQDIPLLDLRVKDLSAERQDAAKKFAAAVIAQARAELHRLIEEQHSSSPDGCGPICKAAG